MAGVCVMFINGIGKLQIQMWTGVFSAILHIPLSYIFVKYFGFSGVAWSMVVVMTIMAFMINVQVKLLVSGSAKGIWIR